jgi:hypothetical protein
MKIHAIKRQAYELPPEYARSLANGEIRKFRHVYGFRDSTDFVAIDGSGDSWIANRNGWVRRGVHNYLASALEFVDDGWWVEVTE